MMTFELVKRMALDIQRGEHRGDRSTYYSAMTELAHWLLVLADERDAKKAVAHDDGKPPTP